MQGHGSKPVLLCFSRVLWREDHSAFVTQCTIRKQQVIRTRHWVVSGQLLVAQYILTHITVMDTTLRFMFPDNPDLATSFIPLTYDIFVREVLIPEATIRLVQQDLGITPEAAIIVLKESHIFGLVLHPVDDDCEFYLAALLSISKSHRRTQWSLRTWEACGTALDFETWLQGQKDMEEILAVKLEYTEAELPDDEDKLNLAGVDLSAAVIDLT